VSISLPVTHSNVRRLNIRRDLLAVADLIELCFSNTLDADGREYLRNLRWAARDSYYLTWLQSAAERMAAPLHGFVWEEDGRIVGNLSLIPMLRGGKLVYWIANVAVHPDFRQRGIGRLLTEKAISHLRERDVHTAWLQVRDDNPVAFHLYETLGFTERMRRTSWMLHPHQALTHLDVAGVTVQPRRSADWPKHREWLQAIYPPDVAWNLSLKISRFRPDWIQRSLRWLQGQEQENWVARRSGQAIGFASWEPTRSFSDWVWLAGPQEYESEYIPALLGRMRQTLRYRGRPLQVNYPAGRSGDFFRKAGFQHHQTLIWMMASF
jgi:ribosomal protein S18 acetylase RimI-like enzyme